MTEIVPGVKIVNVNIGTVLSHGKSIFADEEHIPFLPQCTGSLVDNKHKMRKSDKKDKCIVFFIVATYDFAIIKANGLWVFPEEMRLHWKRKK